jgi:hypothetical protein
MSTESISDAAPVADHQHVRDGVGQRPLDNRRLLPVGKMEAVCDLV